MIAVDVRDQDDVARRRLGHISLSGIDLNHLAAEFHLDAGVLQRRDGDVAAGCGNDALRLRREWQERQRRH